MAFFGTKKNDADTWITAEEMLNGEHKQETGEKIMNKFDIESETNESVKNDDNMPVPNVVAPNVFMPTNKKKENFAEVKAQNSACTISGGTEVEGNIKAEGEVLVYGTVHGNIKCKKLSCAGKCEIVGDVECEEFCMYNGSITGNISASQRADVNGKVVGCVRTSEAVLRAFASVDGDSIDCEHLSVECGAAISAKISMKSSVKASDKGGKESEKNSKAAEAVMKLDNVSK